MRTHRSPEDFRNSKEKAEIGRWKKKQKVQLLLQKEINELFAIIDDEKNARKNRKCEKHVNQFWE